VDEEAVEVSEHVPLVERDGGQEASHGPDEAKGGQEKDIIYNYGEIFPDWFFGNSVKLYFSRTQYGVLYLCLGLLSLGRTKGIQ
jgi:hypothetical protein